MFGSIIPTVFHPLKIQIWKLITTLLIIWESANNCISSTKDTNLKAYHNHNLLQHLQLVTVFHPLKIQIRKLITTTYLKVFKSKYCISSTKDTNSKAYHNPSTKGEKRNSTVFHPLKIQIRKLITTYPSIRLLWSWLYFIH